MPHSTASTCLMLPFGALTGVIPTDVVYGARVPEDSSSRHRKGQRPTEIQQQIHSVIGPEPIVPRSRRPFE